MLVFRAAIFKMLVTIANREDPDQQSDLGLHCLTQIRLPHQKQSDLGLHGLSIPMQVTSVRNLRASTVICSNRKN